MMPYIFITITVVCLIVALVRKRFIFLLGPIVAMILFVVVQIILVPLPLGETLKFIFNLR